jgi:hypothetical protein
MTMPEMRDRVEFAVPPGRIVVRRASCPKGCDLMAADHPIHGHPSIRVRVEYAGGRGEMHLDPLYGGHDNVSAVEIPAGALAEFSCPRCGVSLRDPEAKCAQCAAPMFLLHLPRGGFVEACLRNGCLHHRLHLVTGEQMMQRMFDELGMDAFL